MKRPRYFPLLAATILAIPATDVFAAWWTRPRHEARDLSPPLWLAARQQPLFTPQGDNYDRVAESLRCSNGWLGRLTLEEGGPAIALAWFEWRDTGTSNTLEAFKHLPEECMGSAGMKLEKLHPPRVFEAPEGTLMFDSTTFRPPGGGPTVHVFKAVWVAGYDGLNLREEGFASESGYNVRQMRIKAALTRFRPPRAAILMASVTGLPTENLAWQAFRENVLDPEAPAP